MSGLGRQLADLELQNARAMRAGQARYDSMTPDDGPTDEQHELLQSVGWAEEAIGRAERAIWNHDLNAARDLLREAAGYLTTGGE